MMEFQLSAEQRELRALIRRFVDRSIRPVAHDWEASGRYPTEIVAEMRELGLFGMLVPTEHGGSQLDGVSYAIVFEEISQGWMGIAGILGSHTLATLLIARYGTDEQRARYLPDLARGSRRSGIALTEPDAGSDLQSITTTARLGGDAYLVRGSKIWITNARHADPLPVLVRTDPEASPPHRGMSILLVDADTPGLVIGRDMGKLGYHGPESCEVAFDDARVPSSNLLGGQEGLGLRQALSVLEYGRINVAARSVGIAQAAFDAALAYSRTRRAFGQPIGDFQAVRLRLAGMAIDTQAARLMTWWAAECADRGRADTETAMAKVFASEVAMRSAEGSMRIHAGHGYSTEADVERLYRDAPLMAIGEGANDVLSLVVAKNLLGSSLRQGLAEVRSAE